MERSAWLMTLAGAERIGPSGRLENMMRITAVGVMMLVATAAMAQSRWDGADDLPVNPLACEGGAAPAAAKPYDGGAADQVRRT